MFSTYLQYTVQSDENRPNGIIAKYKIHVYACILLFGHSARILISFRLFHPKNVVDLLIDFSFAYILMNTEHSREPQLRFCTSVHKIQFSFLFRLWPSRHTRYLSMCSLDRKKNNLEIICSNNKQLKIPNRYKVIISLNYRNYAIGFGADTIASQMKIKI